MNDVQMIQCEEHLQQPQIYPANKEADFFFADAVALGSLCLIGGDT